MRKIRSSEEIEKRKKRNQLIVGGILIFIMVFSTIGFSFLSNEQNGSDNNGIGSKISYYEFNFEKLSSGYWQTEAEGQTLQTFFNPTETENITTTFTSKTDNFYKKPLYYVSSNQEAAYEIIRNLYPFIERTQEVCLKGEVCMNKNLVVKTCSDNVVVIREKNTTNIYKSNNCIFIEGPYSEQTKLADRFIFKVFGIQE